MSIHTEQLKSYSFSEEIIVDKITLDEIQHIYSNREPQIRKGQAFINALQQIRPIMYKSFIYQTRLDCFHNDTLLPITIGYCCNKEAIMYFISNVLNQ